ncbi:MAG: element excision factor XisI family protein [Bacteroidota bacterium]
MNKTDRYSHIISTFILYFVAENGQAASGCSIIPIIDQERHHYQALMLGYNEEQYRFSFMVLFHFDIIQDQIWVQANNSDWDFTDELVEKGVELEDLVVGWLPENARVYADLMNEQAEAKT